MSSPPKILDGMPTVGSEAAVLVDDDGQLSINIVSGEGRPEPIRPKPDSVKAAVLNLLSAFPDGLCRRDFVVYAEIYELSNRIGELEDDGWVIEKGKCERHNHRHPFTLYKL